MTKILITALDERHINAFHLPYLKWFKQQGYEVHLAVGKNNSIDNSYYDQIHHLPFQRKPFRWKNLMAYFHLRALMRKQQYALIHCHTPVVSALTRLAARNQRKNGTKVLYTAHGFHFYQGAPWFNWWLYYPIEKILARYTDVIFTLNAEDTILAQSQFKKLRTVRLPGIGLHTDKFDSNDIPNTIELYKKHNIEDDHFVLLYVAELIQRKNHIFLLKSLRTLSKQIPNLLLLLVGEGSQHRNLIKIAKQWELERHIRFLGWQEDVPALIALSDVGVSVSKQEGLCMALLEKMYGSLPVVATAIRGNKDLIVHNENGVLIALDDQEALESAILTLYNDHQLRFRLAQKAHHSAHDYTIEKSLAKVTKLYKELLEKAP